MSIQLHEADAIRQNIAMATAGFLMAGTIIGAGIAGLAVGRELAPPPAAAPAAVASQWPFRLNA